MAKTKMILAIDIGTKTGVALGRAGEVPRLSTQILGQPGDSQSARFSQALHLMNIMIRTHHPDIVAFEKPIASGPVGGESRVQMAFGLRGCMMGVCRMRHIRVVEYAVQSIRKHFLKDGSLTKAVAKPMAFQRCLDLGWSPEDTEQSDAAAVWDLACWKTCNISTPPTGGLFDRDRGNQSHAGNQNG